MAGSLAHIVAADGTFRMDLIENLGDAEEALQECHQIIAALLEPDGVHDEQRERHAAITLQNVCELLGYPVPGPGIAALASHSPVVAPVIQPDLHGPDSVWRRERGDPKDRLIWSLEHRMWWRSNCSGYTTHITEAGRYTEAEADRICRNANFSTGTLNEIAVMAPEGL